MLKEKVVPVTANTSGDGAYLAVTIDRANLSPCFMLSSNQDPSSPIISIPFNYCADPSDAIAEVSRSFQLQPSSTPSLNKIARALAEIFYEKEASCLETFLFENSNGQIEVEKAKFVFDDAAYRSGQRHENIQQLRDTHNEIPEEVEAEHHGIVYIRYESPTKPPTSLNNPIQTPRLRHNRHPRFPIPSHKPPPPSLTKPSQRRGPCNEHL